MLYPASNYRDVCDDWEAACVSPSRWNFHLLKIATTPLRRAVTGSGFSETGRSYLVVKYMCPFQRRYQITGSHNTPRSIWDRQEDMWRTRQLEISHPRVRVPIFKIFSTSLWGSCPAMAAYYRRWARTWEMRRRRSLERRPKKMIKPYISWNTCLLVFHYKPYCERKGADRWNRCLRREPSRSVDARATKRTIKTGKVLA